MERLNKILANAAFACTVLLTFLLIFESKLELPAVLQAFGRMHPLLLHMPVGLLVMVTLLVLLRTHFESSSFDTLIRFLLHISAVTAALSALMGLFLSREGGYDDAYLAPHKWLGAATCYVGVVLIFVQGRKLLFKISLLVCVVVLLFTGHYGSMLTHGDNFILAPLQPAKNNREINTRQTVFEAAVLPLFDRKCAGCHTQSKAKGRLILTSFEHVMKGGKTGKLWEGSDVTHSLLLTRLMLPPDDKKHMPPTDKPQLTADELSFLRVWIARGADTERTLDAYADNDPVKQSAVKILAVNQRSNAAPRYTFDFADPDKITGLNNPYRAVFQLAQQEPALEADFFVRQAFDVKSLTELTVVKEQLVSMSLAKMPIADPDLALLARFSNLESLNLNGTDIAGSTLADLKELEKLRSLSVSGTNVTAQQVSVLGTFKSLKKVFIWNTAVSAADVQGLQAQYPNIAWEIGYVPDATEVLQLSKPLLVSETLVQAGEKIALKASLPGTTIRYTTDGTDPDSVTQPIYEQPLTAKPYQLIKAIAFKEGWKHSEVADFIIFKTGYKPSRGELKTVPEPRYKGEGITTFSDGKKGSADFFRDPVWMGFRNGPLEAVFYFEDAPVISSVTLSYADNVYAMTMAPAAMEVWGGDDENSLTLLQRIKPEQPEGYGAARVRGTEVTFPAARRRCYKIIAKPLAKFPAFYKIKEKGWLMVDEIFFN